MSRLLPILTLIVVVPVALVADTLVLRDGSRVTGDLVSVRNGVVEFEERRGFGRPRRVEFDLDEVLRIEFEPRRGYDNSFGGSSRPSGMRERQITVAAGTDWTDTGINVSSGREVYFEASGQVRWGRDRRDGPAGENNSPPNPGRPMPNRPAAALIGRIGTDGDHFFIGDATGPLRMRANGRLFLGINDDFLQDNSGSFRVVVYY